MRPYRDDDNEQFRKGWQRRWQDDMQTGARPRRAQGYAEERYPGDRYASSERDRERYGNPLERYGYDEPWRMPSPYRLRRPGYDDEGYRVTGHEEEHEASGLGNYRRPYPAERSVVERSESYDRHRGPYRGRGPKGYRRSDEAIKDEVSQHLEDHGLIDASDIEVVVREGVVTLEGSVDHRGTKRLAEDVAENVHGVKDVENHLRVDTGFHDREPGSSKHRQESSRQV